MQDHSTSLARCIVALALAAGVVAAPGIARAAQPTGEQKTLTVAVEPEESSDSFLPSKRPLWGYTLIGGVVWAGAGVGIAGIVLQQQHLSEADAITAALPGACGSSGPGCNAVNDRLDDADSFLAMGVTGFSIAGAASVGALLYALLPGRDDKNEHAIRIVPALGSTSGAVVEGHF
ncbi:MAG: hypothetical protein HOW73_19135 [Polyangiaceae bacterium]|nr:hypothetical protein [Polyangiaceae bacterium]